MSSLQLETLVLTEFAEFLFEASLPAVILCHSSFSVFKAAKESPAPLIRLKVKSSCSPRFSALMRAYIRARCGCLSTCTHRSVVDGRAYFRCDEYFKRRHRGSGVREMKVSQVKQNAHSSYRIAKEHREPTRQVSLART